MNRSLSFVPGAAGCPRILSLLAPAQMAELSTLTMVR
jgi:hypothetical protein